MSTPAFRLLADGADITSQLADRLVSIRLTDQAGQVSDSLEIALDDREKRLPVPRQGAWLKVWLGYSQGESRPVFMGSFVVDEVTLSGGLRSMVISATAAAAAPELVKASRTQVWRNTTLGEIVAEIAKRNGLQVQTKGNLSAIQIRHEDQTNETDQAFLTRLAEKFKATIKPSNGYLVMLPRGSGEGAGTFTIEEEEVEPGWRAVLKNRGAYSQVRVRYLDRTTNTERVAEAGSRGPQPVLEERGTFRDQAEAQRAAASRLQSLQAGEVRISLTTRGRPDINAEGLIVLRGFRPEVDGTWNARQIEHRLDKAGFVTAIECGTKGEESTEWGPPGTGRNDTLPAGQKSSAIARAAEQARGMNTQGGPDGGNNACLFAVNKVLRNAGVRPPWGNSNYVPTARSTLAAGAGTLLSGPEPGAIAIMRDNGSPPYPHIGIVQSDGRTIISNSSSRGSFSWAAGEGSYTSYYGRTPEYWRLK